MRYMTITLTYNAIPIPLSYVVGYTQATRRKYATKSVPGKTSPTVDTDTFVFLPKTYVIRARITEAERVALQLMADNADYQVTMVDSDETGTPTHNCRVTNVGFTAVRGSTTHPFMATIDLMAEDH